MRCLLLPLACMLLASPTHAQDALDRIALQGAPHRQIRLVGERPAVEFALDPARPLPGLTVVVIEASHGNPPSTADGVFALTVIDGPQGSRLRAEADPTALRTGTYTLRLRVSAPGVEGNTLTVQVSVPAPELRLPTTLSVQRIRPLVPWLFGAGETSMEPLLIREVGRLAGLTDVQLTQLGPLRHDGRGTVGRVHAINAPPVPPGGMATIEYAIEPAQLPAGEVRGTVQLSARELSAPIDIPLVISTRVDPLWIVALVFAGVLLGYISRTLLGRWRARAEALALAVAERRALAAALDLAGDSQHRATLDQIRGALDEKIAGSDPQAIVEATTESRTRRIAARDALKVRHEALANRLDEVVGALSGRALPSVIAQRINGRLDAIRAALVARETDRAEALLDDLAQGRDLVALRAAWSDWRHDADRRLRTLASLGDLAAVDPAAASAAVASLSEVADLAQTDFGQTIAQGALAYAALHRLVGDVCRAVDASIDQILTPLGARVDPALAESVRDVHQRARKALSDGEPIEALALLVGELTTALATVLTTPPARPDETVRALVAEHQYRAAAAVLTPATRGIRRSPDFRDGGEIPEAAYDELGGPAGEGTLAPVRAPGAPSPEPAVWRRDVAVARLAFDTPPSAPALDPPDPRLPQILGSLVNAVVIALVAYVIYADAFIGDGKQLISTLLWAYGLDLGAEAVKAQLRQVTPTGR